MRFLKVLLPLAIAAVIALSAFAVPASAAAPAPVPTWQVGQSVAYGTSLDLGALASTYLDLIRNNPSMFNITRVNALNLTGSIDTWEVDQVTQKTSTYYTLASHSAEGLKLDVGVNLTMKGIPQAGTYQGTRSGTVCIPPTVTLGSSTVAAELHATMLSTTVGSSRLQVSNLAYINETQNATLQAKVSFTGYHIPVPSLDNTTCTETVTYENPSFTLTVDTNDQVRALNQPVWDYFNFPITDNKTWWANTTATVGATLTGTINVQGLSSRDQAAFFDNVTKAFQGLGLTVMGFDAFPIDLSKLTVMLGPSYIVNHGVVTDYPVPLHAEYRAIASAMTLSDGNQYPVYMITNASYQCPTPGSSIIPPIAYAAVYAPDFPSTGAGMIVGYQLIACAGTQSLPAFQLTNTKPADAQQKITQTETKYQVVPPAQTNAFADFFLQAPYLGLILVAVVVVVAAAAFVMWRRRRMASPPGAHPPVMPPPPPPPGDPGNP